MSYNRTLQPVLRKILDETRLAGTYKYERIITTPQESNITANNREVLNFCANNYLGLSNHPVLVEAAKQALHSHGYGLSSVRFICGTQDIHKQLEKKISDFHSFEDTILYSSCFDANAGFFEALLTDQDAIISDALNHASIIDGIRLCKAERHRYDHLNMQQLEEALQQTQDKRIRMIVTDGVFSMDGDFAPLDKIRKLADQYDACIFVDESHSTGFVGQTGRGTPEYFGVEVDVINSTLGKALGGATGGYTTGRQEIIDVLRNKSRPYLFSNSMAPTIVGAGLEVFDMLTATTELRDKLHANTLRFRAGMEEAGFKLMGHPESPIAPIMLGDAKLAAEFAEEMLELGIYVIGFSFPVVPKGQARIRVQLSAGHSIDQVDRAVEAFKNVALKKGTLPSTKL